MEVKLFTRSYLDHIGKTLIESKQTISVAESVSSGLLQFALSTIENATQFYQGGITTYNLAQKFKHLQVEPIHAAAVDCVSAKVATEMATQVCLLFHSDWGLGITGYATSNPETNNQLYAYYSIVYKGKNLSSGYIEPVQMDPAKLQVHYANEVFRELSTLLRLPVINK